MPTSIEILSSSSKLYPIPWPIIIRYASVDQRVQSLQNVNRFFRKLCRQRDRSNLMKEDYLEYYGNITMRPNLPFVIDSSLEMDWLSFGADKCGFGSQGLFRLFCAIGNVDPDSFVAYVDKNLAPGLGEYSAEYLKILQGYIWMSRDKDLIFETSSNPLDSKWGYCHYFGLTGNARKARAMYDFLRNKEEDGTASYADLCWERQYM